MKTNQNNNLPAIEKVNRLMMLLDVAAIVYMHKMSTHVNYIGIVLTSSSPKYNSSRKLTSYAYYFD